jgi:hypothetical protein
MDPVQFQSTRKPADMAFLAMAVLVHAALLLVPLKDWNSQPSAGTPRLTVDLRQLPPPVAVEPPRESQPEAQREAEPAEKTERRPEPEERRTARIVPDELPRKPDDAQPQEPGPEANRISAQELRELVRQSALPKDENAPSRHLGTARPWQPPANWNKHAGAPYLAEFDNTFNGMTAPEESEIVDRWVATDGSHNVVVNLPNGDTVCGRAEPYNPMQPLVEPVMMFRPCGGGGKRTFSMPDRYKKGQ